MHDKQGQVVNAREMKAFGEWENSNDTINNDFAGQYRDNEANTYYNFHRDYNPSTGRYIESDPIKFKGNSFNLYKYANNNSLRFIDETGLKPVHYLCTFVQWLFNNCPKPKDNDDHEDDVLDKLGGKYVNKVVKKQTSGA